MTPIRLFLAFVDWVRERLDDGYELRAGPFFVEGNSEGIAVDTPWLRGLLIRVSADDDCDGDEGPDGPETTARVLCDHALEAVIVDAVQRGRNGGDPHEVAGLMLREMELDEVEQNVEEEEAHRA